MNPTIDILHTRMKINYGLPHADIYSALSNVRCINLHYSSSIRPDVLTAENMNATLFSLVQVY